VIIELAHECGGFLGDPFLRLRPRDQLPACRIRISRAKSTGDWLLDLASPPPYKTLTSNPAVTQTPSQLCLSWS
jgi:hypothetical protein